MNDTSRREKRDVPEEMERERRCKDKQQMVNVCSYSKPPVTRGVHVHHVSGDQGNAGEGPGTRRTLYRRPPTLLKGNASPRVLHSVRERGPAEGLMGAEA